jgi:hypothetical protein
MMRGGMKKKRRDHKKEGPRLPEALLQQLRGGHEESSQGPGVRGGRGMSRKALRQQERKAGKAGKAQHQRRLQELKNQKCKVRCMSQALP